MTTLRWELLLTEKSRHGTYDLRIAYKIPDQQTDEETRKMTAFRRLHKQCLRDKIPSKESLSTEEWEDGSLVIKDAHVTSLDQITTQANYPGAEKYKLYFGSSEDAKRLFRVIGFKWSPKLENGSWSFLMPAEIRDDSDEWEEYENPERYRLVSIKSKGHYL